MIIFSRHFPKYILEMIALVNPLMTNDRDTAFKTVIIPIDPDSLETEICITQTDYKPDCLADIIVNINKLRAI
jgi:hypothetical protein